MSSLPLDPTARFRDWMTEAEASGSALPNAMTLATIDQDGAPAARMVLLKGVDDEGFVFFTNYDSDKARHLALEPRAALVFWWPPLERQVRVTGSIAKVSAAESEAYFATRPFGSRLSAWASPQSSVIESRDELEHAMAEAFDRFGDEVPLPPWWGGYRMMPSTIEFWQGRPDRLHDRLRYTRHGDRWDREVLAP